MKYSREQILKQAFEVFMDNGYDSTSISVLQRELKMSRGAMYRYFTNKEDLFISVIDEYFLKLFYRILNNLDGEFTLKKLIEVVYRQQKVLGGAFIRAGATEIVFWNYTALMIQAAKHYPNFIKSYQDIQRKFEGSWRLALQNSIDAGEVRADVDIDILCELFVNSCWRETSRKGKNDNTTFAIETLSGIENRKRIMDYLYTLIKT